MNTTPGFDEGRKFLKSPINSPADVMESDQGRKKAAPPVQKEFPESARLFDLAAVEAFTVGETALIEVLRNRKSRRKYTDEALTLEELSFLLWAVQGIRKLSSKAHVTFRTVPAGGGIHPLETYLVINRVGSLPEGLYRYLPLEHKLLFLRPINPAWSEQLGDACRGQEFVSQGAVVFIWTAIPYRAEWRYANEAHEDIALYAGHACQNLYLASEAIAAGTCAITGYAQKAMELFIDVDGEQEFVVYVAPVGKVS